MHAFTPPPPDPARLIGQLGGSPDLPIPNGARLLHWLRINLPVALFLTSLVSAAAGALINGTFRIASYDFRIAALEALTTPRAERIAGLEIRLTAYDERRPVEITAIGQLTTRVGVLEAQVKFIGDLAHEAMTAQTQGKHR